MRMPLRTPRRLWIAHGARIKRMPLFKCSVDSRSDRLAEGTKGRIGRAHF